MTDTDAGKRLSDTELAEISHSYSDEALCSPEAQFVPASAVADIRSLLSHIAALTANRGSVSEERAREIAHNIVGLARERGAAAGSGYRYSRENAEEYVATAIQQAVSECSGGGAEEMRAAILSVIPGGSICDPQQIADAIRALPLPPSPVKLDHRSDCQLYTVPTYGLCTCDFDKRMAARVSPVAVIETLETIRYVCKNCMGGDGIKTIDELASVAINTFKSTPHQGGEGK